MHVHKLKADGTRDGEPIDSEIMFERPLIGMGVVAATGSRTGARLLWYERLRPRIEGEKRVQRAALMTGRIDREGKLVDKSRKQLHAGDRAYGHVFGHTDPQVYAHKGRAIYVGRFHDDEQNTSGYEASRLGPIGALTAPSTVFAVDPVRLAEDRALDAQELAAYKTIWEAAPRLVVGQSPREYARVAWAGSRGWFFSDDGAFHSTDRSGNIRDEPPPFTAKRSRVHWAALDARGGIALTSDGLMNSDGDNTGVAVDEAMKHPLTPAVRVGAGWWIVAPANNNSGAVLRRLLPSPVVAKRDVYAGHVALVEGGTVLIHDGEQLSTWRLSNDGGMQYVAAGASPVRPGFVATRRAAGGALVAGRARDGTVVVFSVNDRGVIGAPKPSLKSGKGDIFIRARPSRGAWVSVAAQAAVAWHDDSGDKLAEAPWPSEASAAACVDGEPLRSHWPDDKPGSVTATLPCAPPTSARRRPW